MDHAAINTMQQQGDLGSESVRIGLEFSGRNVNHIADLEDVIAKALLRCSTNDPMILDLQASYFASQGRIGN